MTDNAAFEEGTIRVTTDGSWLHEDAPVAEPVAAVFRRHVTVGEGGDYIIDWQKQRHQVAVDDTAFFVRQVHVVAKDARLKKVELTLSDGSKEALQPETLMQSDENVLYCRIDRNGFSVPCRFDRAQYHALAAWMEEPKEGLYVLPVKDAEHPIHDYDNKPTRQSESRRARHARHQDDN